MTRMESENTTEPIDESKNVIESRKKTSHLDRKNWQEMLVDDENRGIADAERHVRAMLNEIYREKPWALREF